MENSRLTPYFEKVERFILCERRNRYRYLQKKRSANLQMKIDECESALDALKALREMSFRCDQHVGTVRMFLEMELEMRKNRILHTTNIRYWREKLCDNQQAVHALDVIAKHWNALKKEAMI